jgi:excisionase family DNA binding protein
MVRQKKDRLLTVKQVASRLKLDYQHVYKIISAGLLPCVRIGLGRGIIRIKESDLEAYIERKENGK